MYSSGSTGGHEYVLRGDGGSSRVGSCRPSTTPQLQSHACYHPRTSVTRLFPPHNFSHTLVTQCVTRRVLARGILPPQQCSRPLWRARFYSDRAGSPPAAVCSAWGHPAPPVAHIRAA